MAVEVVISTLAGNTTIALPGDNVTVQDVVDDERVTGYDSSKIVRVNNEDATMDQIVNDNDLISFASPSYKHG